jgi:23S rRNA (adenine2030-N6)-methyltransferase
MKHIALTAMLNYMTRKEAGICYIDTHAGAGVYDLLSDRSQKTGESSLGIAKLMVAGDAPEAVADYLDLVRLFNPAGELTRYPGSPWFAAQALRTHDRLVLCELHSSDLPALQGMFAKDQRVHCHAEDGYRFSHSLLPPIERRGLLLMDPSYELGNEYATAAATISALHRKFATGTYALWYPILDEQRTAKLRRHFIASPIRDVLHLALRIADEKSFPGMYGCGLVVINPPWTLRAAMERALPWLVSKLGVHNSATFQIEQWVEE